MPAERLIIPQARTHAQARMFDKLTLLLHYKFAINRTFWLKHKFLFYDGVLRLPEIVLRWGS